jgi:hypothetical protein
MKASCPPPSGNRRTPQAGFALVVTLTLMGLLTLLVLGLLGLANIEQRGSSATRNRAMAMANARLSLNLALAQLQRELGDDRRITADAGILGDSAQPAAVGVWNSWSPQLGRSPDPSSISPPDYRQPKDQSGFRSWLGSSPDATRLRRLDWHQAAPATGSGTARLFAGETSGFDLAAEKIAVPGTRAGGALAWAAAQENTKARINIGVDDALRASRDDRLQAPARPFLGLAEGLSHPQDDWPRRAARVSSLAQAALDPAYGAGPATLAAAARDFTADALTVLSDPVRGGLKVDLSSGFELSDAEFTAEAWSDRQGRIPNPFRGSGGGSAYQGQVPLFQPLQDNAQLQVFMNFPPASVNHKFQVNGVPTFDSLRAFYRSYRHVYQSDLGPTVFERPYSHVAIPQRVAGRPFGLRSQPALAPVLDRMNLLFSIVAKSDGTMGILLTPFITLWNPHNVAIQTEGVVVYPWIDFAVFWAWNVTPKAGGSNQTWSTSLSRFVGEGFDGHGRSTRPYFYLHLTENGAPVSAGTGAISPPLTLEPGEVRVFCLADTTRRDLEIYANAPVRTWRMRPVREPSDITSRLQSGIVLNMTKSIGGGSNFNYRLQPGDRVNSNTVTFDRDTYFYIVNMADSFHIKNPNGELMVEARPANGNLPALPAEPNLLFYGQIHAGQAFGKGRDAFTYPSYIFEEINENPRLVGSLLTYHRVAEGGSLPLADLNFTTNARQPYVNQYLSGARFQTGPHYESLMQGGSALAALAMETTLDGRKAFYGASHSAATGRPNLAFFEIPRTPTLSLGALQHCDITATAFGNPSQIGNSWASPYLPAAAVAVRRRNAAAGEALDPSLGVYDASFLANEALFDSFFFSGAAPRTGAAAGGGGGPSAWEADQVSIERSVPRRLEEFFANPAANPLHNPRMAPHPAGFSPAQIKERLDGPTRCVRLAAHLLLVGGFNINSTSEEAWTAVLASLRGAVPEAPGKSALSRFRHIETGPPVAMTENDPWTGFRALDDTEVRLLARNLVAEIKRRGPFLSLGEFVNRQISANKEFHLSGAIQTAIDRSGLNNRFTYPNFSTNQFPHPENLPNPNTGTNTPGWLSQADVLHSLAPFIATRSDTFVVRTLGEARHSDGRITAAVRLEALVQRVPEWLDPADDPATRPEELKSPVNQRLGRQFKILSVREILLDPAGNPV